MGLLRMLGRTLILDRNRALLSTFAVAAAVVLIVVLEGFQVGRYRQIREYPQTLNVPLIATQAGVKNMTGARSIVPLKAIGQVEAVPGVVKAHPLVGVPLIYSAGGSRTPIYVVAYDGRGGPKSIASGRELANPREIVVDRALARRYDLQPGDVMELAGVELLVAGIAGGSSNVFNPYVFVKLADAMALYAAVSDQMENMTGGKIGVSFLLIETTEDASVDDVREVLEQRVPSIDVLTPDELGANDVKMADQLMGGVMGLLVAVAYAIGILVIGLTLYASISERLGEFGIMKAIGAKNGLLYRLVLAEALLLVTASLVMGLLAGLGVAKLIGWLAPQYLVVPLAGRVVARTAIAALMMGAVAALLPIRRVANVDPVMVFRR